MGKCRLIARAAEGRDGACHRGRASSWSSFGYVLGANSREDAHCTLLDVPIRAPKAKRIRLFFGERRASVRSQSPKASRGLPACGDAAAEPHTRDLRGSVDQPRIHRARSGGGAPRPAGRPTPARSMHLGNPRNNTAPRTRAVSGKPDMRPRQNEANAIRGDTCSKQMCAPRDRSTDRARPALCVPMNGFLTSTDMPDRRERGVTTAMRIDTTHRPRSLGMGAWRALLLRGANQNLLAPKEEQRSKDCGGSHDMEHLVIRTDKLKFDGRAHDDLREGKMRASDTSCAMALHNEVWARRVAARIRDLILFESPTS